MANGPASRHGKSMTAAAKADLGTKRICPACAARFYDLQKRPIECPKCQTSFEPEALFRTRRPRQPEAEAVTAGAAAPEEAEDREETETDTEEAEEAQELGTAEEPIAGITDEDEEEAEVTEEEEAAGAGMTVVEDVEGSEIEDLGEDVDEGDEDEGLLEEVEEEGDDVAGIIDPGIGKDER